VTLVTFGGIGQPVYVSCFPLHATRVALKSPQALLNTPLW
jgi:hypothetical protein